MVVANPAEERANEEIARPVGAPAELVREPSAGQDCSQVEQRIAEIITESAADTKHARNL